MKTPVPIIIFEDNNDMRDGLIWLLRNSADVEFLGAYPDANNVENIIKQYTPEIVLMDIQMPGISGIDALKIIKKEKLGVHVVILTSFEDEDNIFSAMKYGASGYLLKTNISDEIFHAIQEVIDGGAPMNARIAKKVIAYFKETPKTVAPDYRLTTREKEILKHLSEGDNVKMIAKKLFLSEQTVSNHVRHIYEKLEVHSRAEAIAKSFRDKIV